MAEVPEPTFVYRFFNADGVLLYVGTTADPTFRWYTHQQQRPWWLTVATITALIYPTREAAEAEEFRAIRAEKPLYNVTHADPTNVGSKVALAKTDRSPIPAELEAMLHAGELLSVTEGARLLQIGRSTLLKYLERGRTATGIPMRFAVNEDRRWVNSDDLVNLLVMYRVVHGLEARCPSCDRWLTSAEMRWRRERQAAASGELDPFLGSAERAG